MYSYLLERYLQTKFQCFQTAESKYSSITNLLSQIHRATDTIQNILITYIDVTQLAQVLAEIYNVC